MVSNRPKQNEASMKLFQKEMVAVALAIILGGSLGWYKIRGKATSEEFGSLCLGILIGGLVIWYVKSQATFNYQGLVGALSVLAGSGVVAIFRLVGAKDRPPTLGYWLYPVGLLIGAVFTMLLLIPNVI
jgi:hypothetical protein